MASVDINIHLANISLGDVKTISVVTAAGTILFSPSTPSGSGDFSTTYAEAAEGRYCVLVQVPPDPIAFPGPVDDPKPPTRS